MVKIPLQPVPAQTVNALLEQQAATMTVRQLGTGVYLSLSLGDTSIVSQCICENANRIVRGTYQGFEGDVFFIDTTGAGADPQFDGLGTRFQLVYMTAAELALVQP